MRPIVPYWAHRPHPDLESCSGGKRSAAGFNPEDTPVEVTPGVKTASI
jgi:hypothetical protein